MSSAYTFKWVFEDYSNGGPIAAVVGPPGPAGNAKTVVAAEPLGGHRAVTVDGYLADQLTLARLAGITKAAGALGALVEYQRDGFMSEPSWNWTPNQPIFVGAFGVLTQTPPVTGSVRRVAWPVSPTEINIDLFIPIQL
ncbi:MAG: hypothetical protein AAF755_10405 [Pseudomonadota bacterium]